MRSLPHQQSGLLRVQVPAPAPCQKPPTALPTKECQRTLCLRAPGLDPIEAPHELPGDVLSSLPASPPAPAPAVPSRIMPRLAPLEGLQSQAQSSTHALFSELSAGKTAALRRRWGFAQPTVSAASCHLGPPCNTVMFLLQLSPGQTML